jgi:hypothetical protein
LIKNRSCSTLQPRHDAQSKFFNKLIHLDYQVVRFCSSTFYGKKNEMQTLRITYNVRLNIENKILSLC